MNTPAPGANDAPRRPRRLLAIGAAVGLVVAVGYALHTLTPDLVFEGSSDFGAVRVVEEPGGLRSLYMGEGRARQSVADPDHPHRLELAYARVAAIGLALAPPDARILYVGLGGGSMPMHARHVRPAAHIDVVEIDPLIVEVAREHFGFRTDARMKVHTADGRAFIEAAPRSSWDLIVLDAFSDDEIPAALSTRQFLEAVDAALSPTGVVVSNLWSSNSAYASMVATYEAAFDQVHLLRVPEREQRILVAGPDGRRLHGRALLDAATALQATGRLGFDLTLLVEQGYESGLPPGGSVLEDGGR